ncbi:hypothetical protein [Oceanomicrobium pacificus]|uniref:Tetratricopeptide repeat-like domain-containing protein n=1 Tax=Oceanomicrobium pacificus TaxID=2692916 RepID=A0A6B0TV49_9RHOB|nr:hypothetical protein [Oceanomicrobium pacificus]MXU65645.1 hypothetical protein [Oceanomicrobium pacificus]
MSETDSFIDEVSEEVRRERLYGLMRKYGWIPILLVLLIVGGAAYNEWRKASIQSAAEATGDAMLVAIVAEDAAAQADAFAGIAAEGGPAAIIARHQEAAARIQADDLTTATVLLTALAEDAEAPVIYQDLALFKLVLIDGEDMDPAYRDAAFDRLTGPDSAFRLLAMEQRAAFNAAEGDTDAALAELALILDDPQTTNGLRSRAQQMIIALGGSLPETGLPETSDG